MPLVEDRDVAIWVCRHGDTTDVIEYLIGEPEPQLAGCGLHGEEFVKSCPRQDCPQPLYHPSDLDDNYHKACKARIPWAESRYEHSQVLGYEPFQSKLIGTGSYMGKSKTPPESKQVRHQDDLSTSRRWLDAIVGTRVGEAARPLRLDPAANVATGASAAESPTSAAPYELDAEQRTLLRFVWATLNRDAPTWPDLSKLQQQLDASGMEYLDVARVARSIPASLLHFDRYSARGELRLSVEGVAHCPDSRSLLDAIFNFVTFCADRYRESTSTPPTASMTRTEVAGRLGLVRRDAVVRRLFLVMQEEKYVYGGSTEPSDGEWVFYVDVENIRNFLRMASLDDYRLIVTKLDARFADQTVSSEIRDEKNIQTEPQPETRAPTKAWVARVVRFFTAPVGQGAQDAIRALTVTLVITVIVGAVGWMTGWLRQLGLPLPDAPNFRGILGR